MPHLPVTTSGISFGVLQCLSQRVSVHSLGRPSRWVCIPLPDPPWVWRFLSPHPPPHLPCRLSLVLLYLPLIFPYRTSSNFYLRIPTVGYRIPSCALLLYSRFGSFHCTGAIWSWWAVATLHASSFCEWAGLPCSCRSFNIHHSAVECLISLSQPKVFCAFLNHFSF